VEYEPVIERSLTNRPVGAWVGINLACQPLDSLVFTIGDNELRTFNAKDAKVQVPVGEGVYYYLLAEPLPNYFVLSLPHDHPALYAVLALYANRMRPEIIWPVLKKAGDVKLIKDYAICFGKQRYTQFQADCQKAAFEPLARQVEGYNPDLVPPDDAFTLIELFDLLNDKDRVLLKHPALRVNKRLSRKRQRASAKVTADEMAQLEATYLQLADDSTVDNLQAVIKAADLIIKAKPVDLVFEDNLAPYGYPIDDLVFNQDRANLSLRFKIPGTINLLNALPAELVNKLPFLFHTHRYHTLPVVADGLVNVDVLPMLLSPETQAKLDQLMWNEKRLPTGVVEYEPSGLNDNGEVVLLHLSRLPVINRKMVKASSAKALFLLKYEQLKAQAAQKVWNHLVKAKFPKVSQGLVEQYGLEAANWLESQGIKDYGFSPKTVQGEASDVYIAKEIKVSLKGLMSLGSVKVEDVLGKVVNGDKVAGLAALLVPAASEYFGYLTSPAYINARDKESALKGFLYTKQSEAVNLVRQYNYQLAQAVWPIVVGNVWFPEFSSLEEGSLTLDLDGKPVVCTVEQKEVNVEI
jgi:hypothetical protein